MRDDTYLPPNAAGVVAFCTPARHYFQAWMGGAMYPQTAARPFACTACEQCCREAYACELHDGDAKVASCITAFCDPIPITLYGIMRDGYGKRHDNGNNFAIANGNGNENDEPAIYFAGRSTCGAATLTCPERKKRDDEEGTKKPAR
jgi:hypothetical protein